ncbi:polysaccharide deacetylase family protein [Gilvimarinus sp. F26214L]|uniref:polysaccharide deacetylase family protein n=1 Tax=Gilvimarinus sp. DZF01 TaxID=3461371 RepID=UPI0040462599
MVVEPETFAMHLNLLRKHFSIIPLGEWIDRRHNGQALPPKSCSITFDDGWLDNYEYAFPLLKERQIPATIFAVSHMIGTDRHFWPNRVAQLLERSEEVLHSLPWLAPHLDAIKNPENKKESLSSLVASLKRFPDEQIYQWLDESSILTPGNPSLMNWQQLREMVASGFIDIGSHTCNHSRLREDLDPESIRREVQDSKKKIEDETGRTPTLFCYPNGDVSRLARETVGDTYKAAVTTRRGINSASKLKLYELFRIGIHEDRCDTPAKFCSRLANWY